MKTARPALFLDRDGVIVHDIDGEAVRSPDSLRIVSGIVEVLQSARRAGYLLVVVSNQPDVALGKVTVETRMEIEQAFVRLLETQGISFDAVRYCYHHERGTVRGLSGSCECRKPKPGMLIDAADELNIDLASSLIVGDRASDIKAGESAGVRTVLYDPRQAQDLYLSLHRITPDNTITSFSELIPLLAAPVL
ncbi:MAG: HAD family hydrolase [Bdellovibrionota bacterium]